MTLTRADIQAEVRRLLEGPASISANQIQGIEDLIPTILPPTGSAGGVLSGTYPNPTFAADMATQAELDSEAATRASGDTSAISTAEAYAVQRANHTGTQLKATISDFPSSLPPSGSASGVLSGTYPSPGFAVDMATQAELDAEASTRASGDTSAISTAEAFSIQRANHTGTQTASTISDFDSQVRTDSFMPTSIASGATFTVPTSTQALFAEPISIAGATGTTSGNLSVSGSLIDVGGQRSA